MFSTDVCGGHAVNFSIDKTRADGASYIYNNKPEERAARMVLTIDIGNTNIVLGGYENGALGFCTRISTDKSLEADQYALELSGILNLYKVAGENIEGAIISSVVPQITDTVARALRMFAGVEPLKLTQELPTGVGVNIDTPSELGPTCWPEPSPQKRCIRCRLSSSTWARPQRSRPWTSRARCRA